MSSGSRADHNRFCEIEGWEQVRNARGGKVRHHVTYELGLPDGRILRTRISHPANKTQYGQDLWRRISRDQLEVTESEFWACAQNKQSPDRGGAQPEPPAKALPAQLVAQLILDAQVPEEVVATMTLEEAHAARHAYWSQPRQ